MEKRTLAAIALSIIVLFAFKFWEDLRTGDVKKQRALLPKQSETPIAAPSPKNLPPPPLVEQPAAPVLSTPGDTAASVQTITVEGDLYRAVLDNRGAVLTSWELLHYKTGKGQTFEMIAANHNPEARPYPGALDLGDAAATNLANREIYEVEIGKGSVAGKASVFAPPVSVTLRLRRGKLAIEKTYQFARENYLTSIAATVQKDGVPAAASIIIGEDIGPEYEHLSNPSVGLVAIMNEGGKVKRLSPPKEETLQRTDTSVRWGGLDMQYFTMIDIPSRPVEWFEIQKKPIKTVGLDGKEVARDLLRVTMPLDSKGKMDLYLGPKEQRYLESVPSANLSEVIDYGMFSFIVRPLLAGLKWINAYVHNYGVSIILLTLVLTLALFPFRLKQMLSMKKMQVVQPKVKEIQERYKKYKKTDPKRAEMNREIMDLYKAHDVNPLGGCLPLILQMPLLFAFYQLLAASIDLRQAPFFAWIHDLSVKDPYYILPIIMGVTMLISQKMTPMAPGTDPTQAKMMMIMPVVFTVMFLNVSSGLNLYFLCSNIFQIGFQMIAERWVGDKHAKAKV